MVRVALIGLGGVATRIHLPALRAVPSVTLVGACDPDARRRDAVGRRFAIPVVHADADTLLRATAPDMVVIGAPPSAHHALALLALEHGAHVFCEKPFVRTPAEADEVIAAADRRGRLVAVNNQYRYMPIYREVRARIARGEFGPAFLIQAWQQMFHPPSFEANWRATLVESTLFEFGTHVFDLICYFFDDLPDAVTSHIPRPRSDIAADVVAASLLHFGDGRVASVVLNRISHAPQRYLEMRIDCRDASMRVSLGGVARLSLTWSPPLGRPILRAGLVRGGEARIERGGRSRTLVRSAREAFDTATAAKFEEFVARVQSGATDNAEARHARALIRLVEAAYESARLNRTVALRDDQ